MARTLTQINLRHHVDLGCERYGIEWLAQYARRVDPGKGERDLGIAKPRDEDRRQISSGSDESALQLCTADIWQSQIEDEACIVHGMSQARNADAEAKANTS